MKSFVAFIILCGTVLFPFLEARAETAVERKMAEVVYGDVEYRRRACEAEDCSFEEFRQRIAYRTEVLKNSPLAVGYFVEPRDMSTNALTGFFVVCGSDVMFQVTFLGIGIGTDPSGRAQQGFKLVVGSERTAIHSWTHYLYGWNGSRYTLIRTERFEKPAEN